jgi:hypothetical protein
MIDRCSKCKTICSNLEPFIITSANEKIECPCLICLVRATCEDCVFVCPQLRNYFCMAERLVAMPERIVIREIEYGV